MWWLMIVVPEFPRWRLKQEDCYGLEASLGYIVKSRKALADRDPISKNKPTTKMSTDMKSLYFFTLTLSLLGRVHKCHGVHVEVAGQLAMVSSCLQLHGSWGSKQVFLLLPALLLFILFLVDIGSYYVAQIGL